MIWFQTTIRLPRYQRGFHLITDLILRDASVLADVQVGMMHVFIKHTSASLSINENADPDVRVDMELAMNHVVPEDLDYVHTMEGPDDMPAHVKASLIGSSLNIPISQGRLALGTWQGIYLCEHRNHAEGRSIVITVMGQPKSSDQR
jgi:secondary thiamine-phosphate synthase enzyme